MNKAPDSEISILGCHGSSSMATKQFIVEDDGVTINKVQYQLGIYFDLEIRCIPTIYDAATLMDKLSIEKRWFVIRGTPAIPNQPKYRRSSKTIGDEPAGFRDEKKRFMMLDFDKINNDCNIDVVAQPEDAIAFLISKLPSHFQSVTYYYQFSSSQSVPAKIGEEPPKTISAHIWFFLDKPTHGAVLKEFFKITKSPVDLQVFVTVQPHYTAKPIFVGMNDPLMRRSGLIKKNSDVVLLNEIWETIQNIGNKNESL
jgi:hypothetical protein